MNSPTILEVIKNASTKFRSKLPCTFDPLLPLSNFFRCYPAFFYGLASFIGASLSLSALPSTFVATLIAIPLLLILHAFIIGDPLRRPLLALCIGTASFLLSEARYQYPAELPAGQGTARIELTDVNHAKTPFGKTWSFDATLSTFTYKGKVVARNIPVKLSLPGDASVLRPKAGFNYVIEATLKEGRHGGYFITPSNKTSWELPEQAASVAEWRFASKNIIRDYIHRSIYDQHTAAFLSGMFTGAFDDRILAFELGRFGLQHLMAISGLHFSIFAGIIGLLCSLLLRKKAAATVVIAAMTGYFIFLGSSPSVIRAWISILIALTAVFLEKRGSGLNGLGIGLLAISLWDPLQMNEIGFQFSFGVTAAILIWYGPCERLLLNLFPKRTLREASPMDTWDQHGYCLLFFLRQTLALCLAVNSVALPLTLYHFHKFPLFSLAYNLFFPVLVSLSLLLLTVALSLSWLFPAFTAAIHAINEYYTGFLLNFAFNFPRGFDYAWQIDDFPESLLLFLLLCCLLLGMSLQKDRDPLSHF